MSKRIKSTLGTIAVVIAVIAAVVVLNDPCGSKPPPEPEKLAS